MSDRDLEPEYEQKQEMEHRLLSYSAGDGGSSESVKDGLDGLLDMSSFLDPMLTAQMENLNDDVEMVNDARVGSLAENTDGLGDKRAPWTLWTYKHGRRPKCCRAWFGHRCE